VAFSTASLLMPAICLVCVGILIPLAARGYQYIRSSLRAAVGRLHCRSRRSVRILAADFDREMIVVDLPRRNLQRPTVAVFVVVRPDVPDGPAAIVALAIQSHDRGRQRPRPNGFILVAAVVVSPQLQCGRPFTLRDGLLREEPPAKDWLNLYAAV